LYCTVFKRNQRLIVNFCQVNYYKYFILLTDPESTNTYIAGVNNSQDDAVTSTLHVCREVLVMTSTPCATGQTSAHAPTRTSCATTCVVSELMFDRETRYLSCIAMKDRFIPSYPIYQLYPCFLAYEKWGQPRDSLKFWWHVLPRQNTHCKLISRNFTVPYWQLGCQGRSRGQGRGQGYSHEAEASCYKDEAETEAKAEDEVVVT